MMTIESLTRMPIVSESPIKESTSMVKPAIHIATNAAQSETGMAIAEIRALRHACKNRTITKTVSTTPSPRLCSTPPIAAVV